MRKHREKRNYPAQRMIMRMECNRYETRNIKTHRVRFSNPEMLFP